MGFIRQKLLSGVCCFVLSKRDLTRKRFELWIQKHFAWIWFSKKQCFFGWNTKKITKKLRELALLCIFPKEDTTSKDIRYLLKIWIWPNFSNFCLGLVRRDSPNFLAKTKMSEFSNHYFSWEENVHYISRPSKFCFTNQGWVLAW